MLTDRSAEASQSAGGARPQLRGGGGGRTIACADGIQVGTTGFDGEWFSRKVCNRICIILHICPFSLQTPPEKLCVFARQSGPGGTGRHFCLQSVRKSVISVH